MKEIEKIILQYENDFFSYKFCTCDKLENRFTDDFFECGASGIHTRQDVIDSLSKIKADREIAISDFNVELLSDTVALARYKAFRKGTGRESFHSSIWKNINNDWKIFYHQSTKLNHV